MLARQLLCCMCSRKAGGRGLRRITRWSAWCTVNPTLLQTKAVAAKHPSLTMHCRNPSWLTQDEAVAAAVVGLLEGGHPALQRH